MNRRLAGLGAAGLLLLASGCGTGDARAGAEPIVRDSAGVQIVTNPGQGAWSSGEGWLLEEEIRIGVSSGDPELQFGNVMGVDADREGRIYVLDGQARRVRVFDPQGGLVTSFGRSGGGPGEFSQALSQPPGGLFVGADGTLSVPDMGNQRLSRFGLDGEVQDAVSLDLERGIPLLWTRSADRTLYKQLRIMNLPGMPAQDAEPRDIIVRVDSDTGEDELLFEMPSGQSFSAGAGGMPEIRIFAPEPLWTVLNDGRVVTGSNAEYSLSLRNSAGEVETIVRRAQDRRPVTSRNESDLRDLFAEAWNEAGIPAEMMSQLMAAVRFEPHWPALAQILAGPDGTLWVQRVDPESTLDEVTMEDLQAGRWGSPSWDVFDGDGAYLGVVEMPAGFTPMRFVDDRLYGVHRDELEVQRVVRLRLVRDRA